MLLLHGLGATGAVWRGLQRIGDGTAPDLPGHGTAAWHAPYSFAGLASAVVPLLDGFGGPVPVIGHSMGGVVALELARIAPDRVSVVVGLGIKVSWPPEDVERASAMGERTRFRLHAKSTAAGAGTLSSRAMRLSPASAARRSG